MKIQRVIHRAGACVGGIPALAVVLAIGCAASAAAQEPDHDHADHHHHPAATPPAGKVQFIASTNKPFDALMADAMAVMQEGMDKAPMNHDPNHDFVTMMIPHHQGAVDMAKALLLYSNDQELRTMAQEIIAEQQVEIQFMRAWLARHAVK